MTGKDILEAGTNLSVTIADEASLSDASGTLTKGCAIVGVLLPAAWVAAKASLQATDAEGNAPAAGSVFNVNLNVGIDGGTDTSTVVIRNGSGGSTLATITSSPSAAVLRDIVAYFDGTNWRLKSHHTTLTVGLAIA